MARESRAPERSADLGRHDETRREAEPIVSADDAVAVEVGVEAPFDAGEQVGGHLVVLALLGDDLLQLGVEVERLEAVDAPVEMMADR